MFITPSEMSPGRRRGIFDRESCSTEAVLDWDGIAVPRIMGVSDDDDDGEDEEDGEVHLIGGVSIRDRGDDNNWILLESVGVSD
jgi:hypothetical protein